ncbi:SfnB family sulfur acquisition oxidoreductase, partial [Acinetobacter baumannii]
MDSGLERASDDPYILRDIGNLSLRLHAAEALLEDAAAVLDSLPARISFEQMAQASVAVAEAKVLSTEVALLASEKLFE